MEVTGERMMIESSPTTVSDLYILQVHLASYQYVAPYATDKRVLDFGCGSGYGAYMISGFCKTIVAVDVSQEAIEYAQEKYIAPNLSFKSLSDSSVSNLPFDNKSFDIIMSFQVIEHINHLESYFSELYRLLADNGVLFISTPNRENRLFFFQRPWNRFHIKEFSSKSLFKGLEKYFLSENIVIKGISAQDEYIMPELKRRHKLKWVNLPFTLIFFPDFFRQISLKLLKSLKTRKINSKLSIKHDSINLNDCDIKITFDEVCNKTTDLFAIIKKQ